MIKDMSIPFVVGTCVTVAILSCLTAVKLVSHLFPLLQKDTQYAYTYVGTSDSSKDNSTASTDRYVTHLVTVNDPSPGCGCPDCCQAF